MLRLKNVLSQNILLCMIVIFCIIFWLYGRVLERYGFQLPAENGEKSYIALAFVELADGVYPWNMEEEAYGAYQIQVLRPLPEDKEQTHDGYVAVSERFMEEKFGSPIEDETKRATELLVMPDGQRPSPEITESEIVSAEPEVNAAPSSLEFVEVGEEYFADAVFIGDSRMVGVYEYAGLETATYYAKESMTIYSLLDSRVSTNEDVRTVREGLEQNQFRKVFIMVGINELGTANTEYFIAAYQEVLKEVQRLQPDAVIYVQAIMHVTGEKDEEDEIFNNTNINEKNAALELLANGEDIFYIDVNPIYDDVNGNLREDVSADDVHLLGNCYDIWHDFYLQHGLELQEVTNGGNRNEGK